MIKIICIKPNNFCFSGGNNDTKEFIKSQIIDYIDEIELLPENMMEHTIKWINMQPEDFGDTLICREDDKHIVQVCYKSHNGQEANNDDINAIATFMNLTRQKIHGNVSVLCSVINHLDHCVHASITSDDIVDILYKRLHHTGIIVQPDDSITEFTFMDNPLICIDTEQQKNYQFIESTLLKFNLIAGIEKEPKNNKINKYATKILGKYPVYGDVIFVLRIDDQDYDSITIDTFNKLLKVTSNCLSGRELTDNEKSDEKIEGIPVIKNKYVLLKNRYNAHYDKCHFCMKKFNQDNEQQKIVCGGCFRVYYDSSDCRYKDWQYHKDECLFKIKPINLSLTKL